MEVTEFSSWLRDSERQQWVTALIGPGGIGKSQLIEHIADTEQRKEDVLVTVRTIDLYWTAHQVEVGILRSIALQLGGESSFANFFRLLRDTTLPKDASDLIRGAFFDDYTNLSQKSVLLIFDTLEVASDSAIRFLTKVAPRLRSINPNTRILIAGRQLPLVLARLDYIRTINLKGLTREDFSEYLSAVTGRDVPTEIVARVHEITDGRPMWAGLLADWIKAGNAPLNIDTKSFEDFRRDVLKPVENLNIPENFAVLAIAHLNRRCNEKLLSRVLSDFNIDAAKIIESLSGFTFTGHWRKL